ncbi:MAG: hypothetical protein AB1489_24720 [Acidobacteriota bacterium]
MANQYYQDWLSGLRGAATAPQCSVGQNEEGQYMDEVEKLIQSVSLPLALPEEAFFLFGRQRRIPDFNLILAQLPAALSNLVEQNSTASSCGKNTYLFQFSNGGYLRMKLHNRMIVELAKIEEDLHFSGTQTSLYL